VVGSVRLVIRCQAAVMIVVAVIGSAGCGTGNGDAGTARATGPMAVDERVGAVEGIAFGDGRAQMVKRFGRPTDTTDHPGGSTDPFRKNYNIGYPSTGSVPRPCTRRPGAGYPSPRAQGLTSLSYRDVSFDLCDGRIYYFIVTAAGSKTRRGVRIGQSLNHAKRLYPNLRCGWSSGGTEPPEPLYRGCAGRLAPQRYIWFGRDPIRSIAISSALLEAGPCTRERCP
jgi:hypothetical protein